MFTYVFTRNQYSRSINLSISVDIISFCFCAPLNIISTGYNVPRGSHDGDGLLLGGTVLGPCGNCNWMEMDGDEYWYLSSSDWEEGGFRIR